MAGLLASILPGCQAVAKNKIALCLTQVALGARVVWPGYLLEVTLAVKDDKLPVTGLGIKSYWPLNHYVDHIWSTRPDVRDCLSDDHGTHREGGGFRTEEGVLADVIHIDVAENSTVR